MTIPLPVVIIGAGLTGLVCARALQDAGRPVVVLDKGRSPGGRLATRWLGQPSRRCDTGAQFFSVRDAAFAQLVQRWTPTVVPWCHGFPVIRPDAILPPDGHPRWHAPEGMSALAKHLAMSLDLRCERTVTGLVPDPAGWRLTVEPGDLVRPTTPATGPAETLLASAVILTAPLPQVPMWFARWDLDIPPALAEDLAKSHFDPCLCALLDWPTADRPVLPPPGAARVEDPASPVGWLSSQAAKGLHTPGDALVVHARGDWSALHQKEDDATVLAALIPAAKALVERLGGRWPGAPAEATVKRWKYSLAVRSPKPRCRILNLPATLVIAGDGYGEAGRVEGAVLSGLAAAQAV